MGFPRSSVASGTFIRRHPSSGLNLPFSSQLGERALLGSNTQKKKKKLFLTAWKVILPQIFPSTSRT